MGFVLILKIEKQDSICKQNNGAAASWTRNMIITGLVVFWHFINSLLILGSRDGLQACRCFLH
jgi:hypothetical protein